MIKLIKSKKVDIFIFCFGADLFVLPILIAKFFGRKIIIRTDARSSTLLKHFKQSKSKIMSFKMIENINYFLADRILPESEYMVRFYDFQEYKRKIRIGYLYVEDVFFKKSKKIDEREYHVGYIGRFSVEKGVLEFVQSLPLLQKENINIKALFVGDGDLKDSLKEVTSAYNIQTTFIDWVEKEKIPVYLNSVKLLVLPSRKEGLPNSVLEAMACGTPVLATPIGGIPEIIKDGETGFIMENNSPECIARNIIRAIEYSNLSEIAKNARTLMEKEFTYDTVVKKYEEILEEMCGA